MSIRMIVPADLYVHQPYYQALDPEFCTTMSDSSDVSTIHAPPTSFGLRSTPPLCSTPGYDSCSVRFERCHSYASSETDSVNTQSYGYTPSQPETPTSQFCRTFSGSGYAPSTGSAYLPERFRCVEELPSSMVYRPPFGCSPLVTPALHQSDSQAPAHTSLTGRFEYVAFPAVLPQHPEAKKKPSKKDAPFEAFFGQVKFEATAATIRWVISQVTRGSVSPIHIHRRGPGCFLVYFATAEDRDRLIALNETVLFDNDGIWIAHSTSQVEELREYASSAGSQIASRSRRLRLPKSCMVIRK